MRSKLLITAAIGMLLGQTWALPSQSFYKGPPDVQPRVMPRILPRLGVGGMVAGGLLLAGGALAAYIQLCQSSQECLDQEQKAKDAEKEFAAAREELNLCAQSKACAQSDVMEIEARAGRARERRKEAKAKARLAAISKARLSPNSGAPGFCEDDVYSTLKAAVDNSCKTIPMKCAGNMDLLELERRRALNVTCAQSRDRINYQCFKGGDEDHHDASESAWRAVKNCDEDIYNIKKKAAR